MRGLIYTALLMALTACKPGPIHGHLVVGKGKMSHGEYLAQESGEYKWTLKEPRCFVITKEDYGIKRFVSADVWETIEIGDTIGGTQ